MHWNYSHLSNLTKHTWRKKKSSVYTDFFRYEFWQRSRQQRNSDRNSTHKSIRLRQLKINIVVKMWSTFLIFFDTFNPHHVSLDLGDHCNKIGQRLCDCQCVTEREAHEAGVHGVSGGAIHKLRLHIFELFHTHLTHYVSVNAVYTEWQKKIKFFNPVPPGVVVMLYIIT